jgi:hypothetical protein
MLTGTFKAIVFKCERRAIENIEKSGRCAAKKLGSEGAIHQKD